MSGFTGLNIRFCLYHVASCFSEVIGGTYYSLVRPSMSTKHWFCHIVAYNVFFLCILWHRGWWGPCNDHISLVSLYKHSLLSSSQTMAAQSEKTKSTRVECRLTSFIPRALLFFYFTALYLWIQICSFFPLFICVHYQSWVCFTYVCVCVCVWALIADPLASPSGKTPVFLSRRTHTHTHTIMFFLC